MDDGLRRRSFVRPDKFFFSLLQEHKIAGNDRTNKICFFVK